MIHTRSEPVEIMAATYAQSKSLARDGSDSLAVHHSPGPGKMAWLPIIGELDENSMLRVRIREDVFMHPEDMRRQEYG